MLYVQRLSETKIDRQTDRQTGRNGDREELLKVNERFEEGVMTSMPPSTP